MSVIFLVDGCEHLRPKVSGAAGFSSEETGKPRREVDIP